MRSRRVMPRLWRSFTRTCFIFAILYSAIYGACVLAERGKTARLVVPAGVQAVDIHALGNFSFDPVKGVDADIPAAFRALDGKRVQLAGEMWCGASAGDMVDKFILCYSVNNCCFSGPPKVQHLFVCTAAPGHEVKFQRGTVVLTGLLHVGVFRVDGEVGSIYNLDVD